MAKEQLADSLEVAIKQFHSVVNKLLEDRNRNYIGGRTKRKEYIDECTTKLKEPMIALANQFLFGGYIHVTGDDNGLEIDKKVYLHTIEFYYHECNGQNEEIENRITDYIMYHIPDPVYKKRGKSLTYKDEWRLKRFPIGSLHMHQSGIDITFEDDSKDDRFRASILIREYEVKENGTSKVDTFPTHIYDELSFDVGIMGQPKLISRWVDEEPAKAQFRNLCGSPRINVFEYEINSKGTPKKSKIRDSRPWSYNKTDIVED